MLAIQRQDEAYDLQLREPHAEFVLGVTHTNALARSGNEKPCQSVRISTPISHLATWDATPQSRGDRHAGLLLECSGPPNMCRVVARVVARVP